MLTRNDIYKLKINIKKMLSPIKQVDNNTIIPKDFLFKNVRTKAGRELPDYYLVFFLLVDLLEFNNLGQWEKVAFIIPIDYKGKYYTIEYRKFGLGIFCLDENDVDAAEICKKLIRAVKAAEPYYEQIAKSKVEGTELNVVNNSSMLYQRFIYFKNDFNKRVKRNAKLELYKAYKARLNESWIALSAIDSFYSWTEHIFIHIGILQGKLKNGKAVVEFSDLDWRNKYKYIIGLDNKEEKIYYDKLSSIKSQLRNYYAHGAFGKTGETFKFHSKTGAVPVNITSSINNIKTYSIHGPKGFSEHDAVRDINGFVDNVLWINGREPTKIYIMEFGLPAILTFANDNTYESVMSSNEKMLEFAKILSKSFDDSANMDW